MQGFKSFWRAQATLAEIELIRMLKKNQMRYSSGRDKTPQPSPYKPRLFAEAEPRLPIQDLHRHLSIAQ